MVNPDDADWSNLYGLEETNSREASPPNFSGSFREKDEGEGKGDGKQGLENRDGLKLLPFEFIALEACLEAACSCLDNEVRNRTLYLVFIFLFGLRILIHCLLFFISS